ncbi:hypothetical protein CROQUDRAFT_42933 [Cronartium quercuum f. sp. fusiforme G11]|uniref:Uncharacterized protein n=1 Tax=Cronartium quercuum f. sp. fusiforme G11 TaxID=708437 RepID=A0A9P6NK24_9BASI|nr:hypothetical protein CROQUDRAFT_42933 [Cronartium quercuum f. sp. fusiforme G11]
MPFPPLLEYLKFSHVPDVLIPDVMTILQEHGIFSWTSFLKVHWLNPERLEKWGISYGIGMQLMDNVPVYYDELLASAGVIN